jgi:hypothetical protein
MTLGIIVLFLTTEPTKLPAAVLTLPFLVLFATIFAISWMVMVRIAHKEQVVPQRRIIAFALLYASLPTLLLLLQSIGQLTIRDTVTLFVLFGVLYFYIARMRTAPEK